MESTIYNPNILKSTQKSSLLTPTAQKANNFGLLKSTSSPLSIVNENNYNVLSPSAIKSDVTAQTQENNTGGLLGGIGYSAGNFGLGVLGVGEGIVDYVLGGIVGLFNEDFKKWLLETDVTGDMTRQLNDWYNPDNTMSFVGEVMQGLGQTTASVLGNAIAPGLGSVAVGLGAAGRTLSDTYRETGKAGLKEFAYSGVTGAMDAALDFAGDKISGLSKTVGKTLGKNVSTAVMKQSIGKSLLGTVLKNGLSEAGEEFIEEVADPFLKYGFGITEEREAVDWQAAIRSGAVGFVTGIIGGGVGEAINIDSNNKLGKSIMKSNATDTVLASAEQLAMQTSEDAKTQEIIDSTKQNLEKYRKLSEVGKNTPLGRATLGGILRNEIAYNVSNDLGSLKTELKNNAKSTAEVLSLIDNNTYTAEFLLSGTKKANRALERVTSQLLMGSMLGDQKYTEAYNAILNGSAVEGQNKAVEANAALNTDYDVITDTSGFSDTENSNLVAARNAVSQMQDKSGKPYNLQVVEGSATRDKINAAYNNGVILLNRKSLSSDQWQKDIIHETGHSTEKTASHTKLGDMLYADKKLRDETITDLQSREYGEISGKEKELIESAIEKQKAKLSLTEAEETALEEFNAIASERYLGNEESIKRICRENRTLGQKILNWIRDQITLIKADSSKRAELRRLMRAERLYSAALEESGKVEKESDNNTNMSKINLGNDNYFIKADRNVLTGDNPEIWKKQTEDYINSKIRGGKNLSVVTIEGDTLTLTKETAGKAKYRNEVILSKGKKRLMTDEEFAVKLRAETHIDELSEVSKAQRNQDGTVKIKPDYNGHYLAGDGWSYRNAYFQDFDGSYYLITISVGMDGTFNTVYNIGKVKKEMLPSGFSTISGSKAGSTSSNTSIRDNSEKSTDFSKKVENNLQTSQKALDVEYLSLAKDPVKNEARLREMVDAKAKEAGYTVKAYHGTTAEKFNVFAKNSYFSPSYKFAERYSHVLQSDGTNKPKVYAVYLKPGNVKNVSPSTVSFEATAKLDKAKRDTMLVKEAIYEGAVSEYIVKHPNQIKSADLVTYDDYGNVIPLSERFNKEKIDIRYSRKSSLGSDLKAKLDSARDKILTEMPNTVKTALSEFTAIASVCIDKKQILCYHIFGDNMFTALLVYIGMALGIWWMTLILLLVGLACDAFVVYIIVRNPPLFHSWDKTRKKEIKEIVVNVKHKDD